MCDNNVPITCGLNFPPEVTVTEEVKQEPMCPRFPEPVRLQHPITVLKEALEQVRRKVFLC